MRKVLLLCPVILVLVLAQSVATAEDDTKLVLLQILFRHGGRTPTYVYPNDRYGEAPWKIYGGLGQLTQKGMQQHYAFGIETVFISFLTLSRHFIGFKEFINSLNMFF